MLANANTVTALQQKKNYHAIFYHDCTTEN